MDTTTFSALAEPSRLQIVDLLRGGPASVGQIADTLTIRQPQVSKHLKVLAEAGIVSGESVSRHRVYRLESAPFSALGKWVDSFQHVWEMRLDSLGSYLDSMHTTRRITDGNQE